MKNKLICNYALIMFIFFIVNNFLLRNLRIGGLLYWILMYLFIIINAVILVKYRKTVKYKKTIMIIYFFIWLFARDFYFCMFALSNIFILMFISFFDGIFIKIISILMILYFAFTFWLNFFIILLNYWDDFNIHNRITDVYPSMHYYCDKNFEVYAYSAGAMDSYHYSIGKHYEILDIDGIIYISIKERNEVTQEEYQKYIANNKCRLVDNYEHKKNR